MSDGGTEQTIRVRVNGEDHRLAVPALRRLLDVLRDDLGLCGTKEGCGEGECGSCTVLVDGVAVVSCLVPACQVDGAEVTTIEAEGFEVEQQAFLEHDGVQCGLCTPGAIVATRAWLAGRARDGRPPDADAARRALAGNLCRCTGYAAMVRAALAAGRRQP